MLVSSSTVPPGVVALHGEYRLSHRHIPHPGGFSGRWCRWWDSSRLALSESYTTAPVHAAYTLLNSRPAPPPAWFLSPWQPKGTAHHVAHSNTGGKKTTTTFLNLQCYSGMHIPHVDDDTHVINLYHFR